MTATVLVFGVSGVGKTTACKDYSARHQDVAHFSASELLQSATGKSPEELRTASVQQIRANQDMVAGELRRRVAGQVIGTILVDAHSVIDNGEDLVRVPLSIVESLAPQVLVLLEAPAAIVRSRRRGGLDHALARQSLARIGAQLEATREEVHKYGQALRLPVKHGLVVSGFRLDEVLSTQ